MTAAAFLLVLPFLFRRWWQSDSKLRDEKSLVWALAVSWTLVLNLYLGIYDSTLVVLSVLLTTDVLYQRAGNDQPVLPTSYKFILLLLYVVPWITQPIARLTAIQLYTLVLALFGIWQLVYLQQLRSAPRSMSLR
jgi:hypothetical protein